MNAPESLAWTGERMIPFASDPATQLFHYQRYLFFRPWYDGAKVIDAASGEGYGTAFAAPYAEWARGVDVSAEAVAHAAATYPNASFNQADVCAVDYSDADLVVSFETIEHLDDPQAFLNALRACTGRIVISTPNRDTTSPGNTIHDKPRNVFHTIEWTPSEFADLIREAFPDRQVRFLSQEGCWPGLIREGLDENAMYCIAVIGDGKLPRWPSIGLSMPTMDHPQLVQEAVMSMSQFYPGELRIAVVANGSSAETLVELRKFANAIPNVVTLVELPENVGYGRGCNTGLAVLEPLGFDLLGVVNDDILVTPSTLGEMVQGYAALSNGGHNPGILGPVSNNIHGKQQVEIEAFENVQSLMSAAALYHEAHHANVTAHHQLRGFFYLLNPELVRQIGGFDPRFGIGNFEDDDYCLRAKIAGFTSWIVDGAFVFHHGSRTFAQLGFDQSRYAAQIERNAEIFQWKWDVAKIEYWPLVEECPEGETLFVPLDASWEPTFTVNCNGEMIDLVSQASDIEFAKWVYDRLKVRHRAIRAEVVSLLMRDAVPAHAAVESATRDEIVA